MINSALILITMLFVIFITLRSVFSLKICALCGAVSVTWIVFITLLYLGYTIDPILVGLLIGGSIVGSMYLLEEKLSKKYQLFKLPYFLTLTSLVYFLLIGTIDGRAIALVLGVWLLMVLIYIGRHIEQVRFVGRKIIACCKNW